MSEDINPVAPADDATPEEAGVAEQPAEQAQAAQEAAEEAPADIQSDQPSQGTEAAQEPARAADQRHPNPAQGGRAL